MVTGAKKLPEVILLGEFPFPTGSAASNNLRGHCLAIRQAGFSVGVLPNQAAGNTRDIQPDGTYLFRGVQYWPLEHRKPQSLARKIFSRFAGRLDPQIEWLQGRDLSGVKGLIAYTGCQATVPFLSRLRKLCRYQGIKLLSFVVEWHRPMDYEGPFGILDAMDGEIQRRWVNRRIDCTLCISKYLQRYYEQRGGRSVLIPPLLDLADPAWRRSDPDRSIATWRPLRLLFSGAYKRDRQDIILHAIQRLRKRGCPVSVEYLGASRNDIMGLPGVSRQLVEDLGEGVVFHGHVPAELVYEIASSASFGILLRERARWSEACFPSKVPEFFALGVPLLCNLTGDLGDCLKDGHNGIVVPAVNVEAFCHAVEKALALNQEQYGNMREAARRTAAQFDGSRFSKAYQCVLG